MGSAKRKTGRESAATSAPREIELKLAGSPEAIEALTRHPLLQDAAAAPEAGGPLHAIYFDTPDEDLRRAGVSARVRRKGEAWIQTVKAETGGRGVVLDRAEWETEVAGEGLDLKAAKGTALGPLLKDKAVKAALRPAFTVLTERQAYLVRRDEASIELVLDRATIEAESRSRAFGEVEVELKAGEPRALFRAALDLVEAAELHLSVATKAERGYALLGRHPRKAVKAERIDLAPGLTTAQAFQAVARSCLSQALQNEAIVRETQDPSALHQMRVGLRRLRAATSLFKDMLDDAESDGIRAHLRWISQTLGQVRDLDVFTERLRKTPEGERVVVRGAQLAEAEERRRAAYADLAGLLESPRFRRTIMASAAWIEAGQWLAADDPDAAAARAEPIEGRAHAELGRRWKRVLKRAKRLAELDPEARHRVRIEIKKLRYGAEFFQGLFAGKRAKDNRRAALEGLEGLQELLGELNDIAVGGHLLNKGAESTEVPQEDARTGELVARAQKDYRRLAGVKPFWE